MIIIIVIIINCSIIMLLGRGEGKKINEGYEKSQPRQNKLRYPIQLQKLLRDFCSVKLSTFT